ncbi:MAG: hypothetical protein QG670_2751, partial [Thermoproteota archaeon]|nr:hypothetical protein [Thermoproteota archaeon]
MQLQHFIYTSFPGRGWDAVATSGVSGMISTQLFRGLCQLTRSVPSQSRAYTPLYNSKLMAVAYLRSALDDLKRPSFWNHTILCPLDQFNDPQFFEDYFIENTLDYNLTPIDVDLENSLNRKLFKDDLDRLLKRVGPEQLRDLLASLMYSQVAQGYSSVFTSKGKTKEAVELLSSLYKVLPFHLKNFSCILGCEPCNGYKYTLQ